MVVKLSNDIIDDVLMEVIESLVELNYDGVVLGNTSTSYQEYSKNIH